MFQRVLACILWTALCLPGAAQDAGHRFGDLCLRARAGSGTVRILHFGDSHLAGMEADQDFSRFFHAHFGHGGPGLCLPWISRRAGLSARASQGWLRSQRGKGDGRMGLSGMYLEARRRGEWVDVTGAFSRFRFHLLRDPAGGKAVVSVDGVVQGEIDLAGAAGQWALFQRTIPGHRIELRVTRDGPVRILGVALERASGAVYSPQPFIGARAAWILGIPEELFRSQVMAEAPDMVMLGFGTNEANARDFNADVYRRELEAVLTRIRRAAPQAALFLAGPPDGILKQGAPRALDSVIEIQRTTAAAFNAIFVDQRQVMGGTGSISTWFGRGWANSDLVHLLPPGYLRLSQATTEALLRGTGQGYALGTLDRLPPPGPAKAPPRPEPHPIYTFRTRDGRLFITDDPSKVEGQPGEWIREAPH